MEEGIEGEMRRQERDWPSKEGQGAFADLKVAVDST